MANDILLKDRLKDRGFIDQWGFLIFATLGFAAIVLSKHLQVGVVWVATGACVVMLLFALIIGRAGTGRLHADQAGDNCYYLGLVYTLASLSHAIFTFNPDDAAGTIVQGFGVALATTILGLVLRVFFNQGRPELENIEQQVRLEFMQATAELKSELAAVVQNLNDTSRQLQQSLREIHSSAEATIKEFGKNTIAEIQATTCSATEAIQSHSNNFVKQSKLHAEGIESVLLRIDRHGASLDAVTTAHHALAQIAEEARATVETVGSATSLLSSGLAAAQTTLQAASVAGESATKLAESVRSFDGGVNNALGAINKHLADLSAVPVTMLSEAARSINATCSEFAKHSELALSATRNHNESLAAELARSREMVTKVHSALVDMTEDLASKVEASVR